jgi:hypothetical protein
MMLLDSTMSDLTSENSASHLMPANPSGSELGLKPDVDFCVQPKIPSTNIKMILQLLKFFISHASIVHRNYFPLPGQLIIIHEEGLSIENHYSFRFLPEAYLGKKIPGIRTRDCV